MTQIPLRLVVDHGDDTAPDAIDLRPASGAALHIHLHMASQDPRLPAPTAALAVESSGRGRSGRGVTRPLLLGAAGVLIALVAFDFGARSGAGHAEALAAARARAAGLASLAAPSPAPQASAAPGELPASVQQQLAQRPVERHLRVLTRRQTPLPIHSGCSTDNPLGPECPDDEGSLRDRKRGRRSARGDLEPL